MGKRIKEVRRLVREWADKQGHNKCHYYPEIFDKLCVFLNIPIQPVYIPRSEFEEGCIRYQDELFGKNLDEILPGTDIIIAAYNDNGKVVNPSCGQTLSLPPLPELLLYQHKDNLFWAVSRSCSHVHDLTTNCLRERHGLKLLGVRLSDGTISTA
jgi:hypothetical protein